MANPGTRSQPRKGPPLSFNAWLRWELIRQLVVPGGSFLEVGCGRGAVAVRLAALHDYTGYEPDRESYTVARQRLEGLGTVINSMLPAEALPVFDFAGAFEVLEHLENDRAALESWRRWLRPGGYLLLSVPAHADRFGRADRAAGHFRRYERTDLRHLLEVAGFDEVKVLSYGFPLGFVLEWGRNRLLRYDEELSIEERTARSGRLLQPAAGSGWFTWLATAPFRWMQWPVARTDLGTGYVVRARRAS